MRYWDSSALASLLINDAHSAAATRALDEDARITTWWGTVVECHSAIWNNERRGLLTSAEAAAAELRLHSMRTSWTEVAPSETVRAMALRFLRVHELRAADALQLAAAAIAAEGRSESIHFISNDRRLVAAARLEGFTIISNQGLP
ncbi:MAG TPA: PIN domain-containing protein [Kiritimatiellia bacterium]|nr:PIN domain-containing protein [Kiritimatiellia bacterium]